MRIVKKAIIKRKYKIISLRPLGFISKLATPQSSYKAQGGVWYSGEVPQSVNLPAHPFFRGVNNKKQNRDISPKRRASLTFDSIHTLRLALSPHFATANTCSILIFKTGGKIRLFSDISRFFELLIVPLRAFAILIDCYISYMKLEIRNIYAFSTISIFKLIYRCAHNISVVKVRQYFKLIYRCSQNISVAKTRKDKAMAKDGLQAEQGELGQKTHCVFPAND